MKKPPSKKAKELESALADSVDFAHRREQQRLRQEKLKAARKWLRLDLESFLNAMNIGADDPERPNFEAIWREFHE